MRHPQYFRSGSLSSNFCGLRSVDGPYSRYGWLAPVHPGGVENQGSNGYCIRIGRAGLARPAWDQPAGVQARRVRDAPIKGLGKGQRQVTKRSPDQSGGCGEGPGFVSYGNLHDNVDENPIAGGRLFKPGALSGYAHRRRCTAEPTRASGATVSATWRDQIQDGRSRD
jgi:hypothetical protein